MKAYHDFRLFYNQSLHPELLHLEHRRRRLLRFILVSIIISALLIGFALYADMLLVTWLILIGLGFWLSRLIYMVRVYFQEFKPRIVSLILDFIDNGINYSNLAYAPSGKLTRETFLNSRLYICAADEYLAEDYISGKIREMPFELCELRVSDISPVRSGMETIFKGIFISGDFLKPEMRGAVFVMPDVFRKYQAQSTRAADRMGARRVDQLLLPEFEAIFDTYATAEIKPDQVVSADFQRTLIHFYRSTGREISLSIINSKIYLALHQSADMLEPSLWRSSVSYQEAKAFYDDLDLVFGIIQAMDVLN